MRAHLSRQKIIERIVRLTAEIKMLRRKSQNARPGAVNYTDEVIEHLQQKRTVWLQRLEKIKEGHSGSMKSSRKHLNRLGLEYPA